MKDTFALEPDEILCVNCGEPITPEWIEDSQSPGGWVHDANRETRCGMPDNENAWRP